MKLQMNIRQGVEEFNIDILEHQQLRDLLTRYTIKKYGSSYFIYSKDPFQLISHFNSFDNTLLIMHPEGYVIAEALGTKRFPIGAARAQLNSENAKQVNAIQFKRDLQFPLIVSDPEPYTPYKIVNLDQLRQTRKNPSKLYIELAKLFNRCSDYAPTKKEEFLDGGALADKFCRFNTEDHQHHPNVVTLNTFLLDEQHNNKIIGTQSATVVLHPNNEIDIYLYDEVVDYFSLLTPQQIEEYVQLCEGKKELSDDDKLSPIAKLVEAK